MQSDVSALNSRINMAGLKWIGRWRINNGRPESFVIPFPTTHPVNVVTHGDKHFDYGQYGIHLGQEDVLTFLGSPEQVITARFIDCRKQSPTFRHYLEFKFSPSSDRTLIIPPGVAHTFAGLEGVFTLNTYHLYLPSIDQLLKPELAWAPENDILNLPGDTDPAAVQGVVPMSERASSELYYRIAEQQAWTLSRHEVAHAETRNFTLGSGESVTLLLNREAAPKKSPSPTRLSKIPGVAFKPRAAVITGEDSRIVPVAGPSPFYIVEHGPRPYDFDSFGVHIGQEDHLTFLGPAGQKIRLRLVDMRRGSATLHQEEWHEFNCDPEVELVIPCGVAHALFNMENVFTLNRPVIYVDDQMTYEPGKDVIDWPLADNAYPVLERNRKLAPVAWMESLVERQKQAMAEPPAVQTPKAVLVLDEATGKQVKVVLTRASAPAL